MAGGGEGRAAGGEGGGGYGGGGEALLSMTLCFLRMFGDITDFLLV